MATDSAYFEEEHPGTAYDLKMLKWLYPLTRPYRFLLTIAIALVIAITFLDLALPYVTKIAIDRYIVPRISDSAPTVADGHPAKTRHLTADITDPQVADIVRRYGDRFTIEGTTAYIRFADLAGLAQQDRMTLRRTDLAGIGSITVFFLILICANFMLNFVQVMIMEYTGQMIMHDLRVTLYDHIQHLAVAFFTRNPVGRLVTRVANDTQNMHELFTSVITFVFKDVFLVAGITLVLFVMNWRLTLVSFLIIPFVIFFSVHFSVKARDVFRILRVKLADINTRFSETIGGIRVIQLFGQERDNYRTFADLNHENYEAGMQQIHLYALFMPIIELLGATGIALIIFYGGGKVVAGAISLGSLVAFLSYMKMFFRPIRDIAEKYNVMQNALASAERIYTILQHNDSVSRPSDETGSSRDNVDGIHEIAMEDLSFSYVAGEPVLNNISFNVRQGESIAFVGPTGSGKTTLINLLIRFYEPQSGRILVNGRDITSLDITALRARIALVTQDPFLFSGTIRDNIVAGNGMLTEERLADIITASHCGFILDKLPHGIDTELSEGGAMLSSGERQLISIARALARDPDLIILDEATSYIDSNTERKVQAALSNLMQGRTSIIVAHRLSTARNARRIMVLHRHRIIESGTHEELMAQQGFYYKFHHLHL